MNITEHKNQFLIQLQVGDANFQVKKQVVKGMTGSKWNPDLNMWTLPAKGYKSLNDVISRIQLGIKRASAAKVNNKDISIDPLPELTEEMRDFLKRTLKLDLYGFQEKGVAYGYHQGCCLIGDQQGLGKTAEAIATVVARDLFPCLVITKKSLLLNWDTEWRQWTNEEPMAFTASKKHTWQHYFQGGFNRVGIVNYESLEQYFVQDIVIPAGEKFKVKHIRLKEITRIFKSVIIDESHYVKDGKTKRTKICVAITRHLPKEGVFLLSGTPALNDPIELYTQLTIMNRNHLFGTFDEFKAMYSGKQNQDNLPYLNHLLHKHCYYRRLKTEARADLPEKRRDVFLCDIDNWEEYNEAESSFKQELQENLEMNGGKIDKRMRAMAMVQINVLKKIAAKGKMAAIVEWAENLIEQEEKVVLFAYHRDIQQELVKSIPGAVAIASQTDTPIEVIERNKRAFMTTSDTNAIVCSISAASEGHTLNAASYLGLAELPWTWGKLEQCEDRIHRITNKMMANIAIFLGENTIDRKIYKIIMAKKDMHDGVTGTDENITESVVDQLINTFNF